ncbi:hypothetical protein EB118_18180 [bacterium]|nr:hypothetical protein [bacterium]NDC95771.1 hypothetical protein [bacterium]NDD83034.1 hypothetical protein [bacterium]NDG31988.1 hypothetical protein [bacterium]
MEVVQKFDKAANDILEKIYRKPKLVRGFVNLLLILYAARIAPALPAKILVLFDNVYFKLFVFSLILWTAQFSPSTSLMISLAFMITINLLNERGAFEFMDNVRDEIFKDAKPEFMDNVVGAEYLEGMDNTAVVPNVVIAPSVNDAVQGAMQNINGMVNNTPVVNSVEQKDNAIVITPTVVNTPSGTAVINPSVVISPAVVSTPQGDKIVVSPNVKTITEASPLPEESSSCYPVRKVDMTVVSGVDEVDAANFGQVNQ